MHSGQTAGDLIRAINWRVYEGNFCCSSYSHDHAHCPCADVCEGEIVKVTITGTGLAAPIEITVRKIRDFSVWSGAGASVNGNEETEGFIIDWSQGVVAECPIGLQHYEVAFYAALPDTRLVYVVAYEYSPSTEQGYIYLLGKADQWYHLNTRTILRRREGNWFRATSAWDNFVGPLVERTTGQIRVERD
jgi:hypothetical protein